MTLEKALMWFALVNLTFLVVELAYNVLAVVFQWGGTTL